MVQFTFTFTYNSSNPSVLEAVIGNNNQNGTRYNSATPLALDSEELSQSSEDKTPVNPRALQRQRVLNGYSDFSQSLHHTKHVQSANSLFGLGCCGPIRRNLGSKRAHDDERRDQPSDIPELTPRFTKKIKRALETASASRSNRIEREARRPSQSTQRRRTSFRSRSLGYKRSAVEKRTLHITPSQIEEARFNYYRRRIYGGFNVNDKL